MFGAVLLRLSILENLIQQPKLKFCARSIPVHRVLKVCAIAESSDNSNDWK